MFPSFLTGFTSNLCCNQARSVSSLKLILLWFQHNTCCIKLKSSLKDTVPHGAVGVVVEWRSLQTPISLIRQISVALSSVRRAVDGSERYIARDICWCTAKWLMVAILTENVTSTTIGLRRSVSDCWYCVPLANTFPALLEPPKIHALTKFRQKGRHWTSCLNRFDIFLPRSVIRAPKPVLAKQSIAANCLVDFGCFFQNCLFKS
jgi:hypothetical protein